ncbi:hypothetical protein BS47DRAFT_688358 [Hydnum rufescens UP504]|uniref:Uncharacterized protein n=1 Tax=Hydnum rufescens UP504 TaxID=1448309 RepID=A0A9P6DGW0_9AGAM|nr:hypothetical protein BS47DRAFT_688358 [Hydnum rufescens UP504]
MEVTKRPKHAYITYVYLDYYTDRVYERLGGQTLSPRPAHLVNLFRRLQDSQHRPVLRKITACQDARGLCLEDVFPIEEQGCIGAKGVSRTDEAVK